MIFTELRFIPFFLAVFAVHWLLRSRRARHAWLLTASFLFYACWDWRFLGLIAASILVDFAAARGMARVGDERVRKRWLALSLATNLGLLGAFKYFDFFVESAAEGLAFLGFEVSAPTLGLILPVGISFYTFQTLSYTIDVYRRELKPHASLVEFALFVSFFPQLVAGPIVRAREFLPQLAERRRFTEVAFRASLTIFLIGFFKKACVSDAIAPLVDRYWEDSAVHDLASSWAAVFLFAVQIYCDFSGYSEMAIGCAGLLGYALPKNFDFPFLATNLRDFWRRWHMTLTSWIFDYVYRPLVSRRSRAASLLVTMFLIGLWHGAAWTFVTVGLLHGAGLLAQRAWNRGRSASHPLTDAFSCALTFVFVSFTLIFFRAPDMSAAWDVVTNTFGLHASGQTSVTSGTVALLAALAALHVVTRTRLLSRAVERAPDWAFALGWGATAQVVVAFMSGQTQPFLYFQF